MSDNCAQVVVYGDLQEVLVNISVTKWSDSCVQVNIAPGNYVISKVLNVSLNVSLQGTGEAVNVAFNATKPAALSSDPFYVLQFSNNAFVSLSDIHFTSGSGIIGFENVTQVLITNCTFSYFTEGAVDIYNCGYPSITNCTFEHNGPAAVIKPQPYRGHSAGLSIGLNSARSLGYSPRIQVLDCRFSNNTAVAGVTLYQSSSSVLQKRIFVGRGGGAAILVNAPDPVYALVEDCVFNNNTANSLGGGLYLFADGPSNNTFLMNRTVFIRNRSVGASGAVHIGFLDTGTLTRLHSVLVHNSEFTDNTAPVGGAVSFLVNGIPSQNGEIGNYAYFENCTFDGNSAKDFGAALVVSSVLVLYNRESIRAVDIANCIFRRNVISSSVGGVFGVAYYSINFKGTNTFTQNSGSSLSLAGSLMRIFSGSSLLFISNTNTGQVGGALYVSSLGQVILNDNIQVLFEGNNGSFGAAIVVEEDIPRVIQHTGNNSLCVVQHANVETFPVTWAQHNVSFTFNNNVASVGASVYMKNLNTCLSSDGKDGTAQIFRLGFAKYNGNLNHDHFQDQHNPEWNLQTPPTLIGVQNKSIDVSAYAGEKVKLYVSILDELGNPVSAILRLTDSQINTTFPYGFLDSLTLYNDLSQQVLETEFLVLNKDNEPHKISIATLLVHPQYQSSFSISQTACPLGRVLNTQGSGYKSCQCNTLNPSIGNCNGTTVQFTVYSGRLWGNVSNDINEYGDTLATYPCPMGYCHCSISELDTGTECLYGVDSTNVSSQCNCQRRGFLCGDCMEGLGVSALLNRCVQCHYASGLLIAALIISDVISIVLLLMVGMYLPSWLYPCVFYLQLLPYLTEYFPVSFAPLRHHMYYVSSGLSFYFVYDFCLHSNMSPLVSYFIRYLPLFTAIIICPITLAILQRRFPHKKWHGLWWIVVLMYTHVVHTSMSILNCPRLPRRDGDDANVWYINGNIECFTGWHIPLAILAILILILCVAAVPMALLIGRKKVPRWARKYLRNLGSTITQSYRDEVEWFGVLDLVRRMIALLLIVAIPFNEYSSIFFIAIIMTIYGYVQPYKQILPNILEVALAGDVLIMLLLKNTNFLEDSLQYLPRQFSQEQVANGTDRCINNDNLIGFTTLVNILTPFFFIPLFTTVMGVALWSSYKFSLVVYIKLKTSCHGPVTAEAEKQSYTYSLLGSQEIGGHTIQLPLMHELKTSKMLEQQGKDAPALSSPYYLELENKMH